MVTVPHCKICVNDIFGISKMVILMLHTRNMVNCQKKKKNYGGVELEELLDENDSPTQIQFVQQLRVIQQADCNCL